MMLPDFKGYIPWCGCPVCWPPTISVKAYPVRSYAIHVGADSAGDNSLITQAKS